MNVLLIDTTGAPVTPQQDGDGNTFTLTIPDPADMVAPHAVFWSERIFILNLRLDIPQYTEATYVSA